MQCPSCQFENMPGLTRCGRCGGALHSGAVQVDVNPPRASARRKRLRKQFSAIPKLREQAETLSAQVGKTLIPEWVMPDVPESSILWRLIVPGWGQSYLGHRLRGRIIFWSYLACFLSGLLMIGTGWGTLLLGLAVAGHAVSVLDVVLRESDSRFERLGKGAMTIAALLGGIYVPLWWASLFVASPLVIPRAAYPFERGDVLLTNNLFRSQVGDAVVYNIPYIRFGGQVDGRNANVVLEGWRIDRILAGPGQTLAFDGKSFTLDGVPAPHLPLNPRRYRTPFGLTARSGEWIILPTTDQYATEVMLAEIGRVPTRNVLGTVIFQLHPLTLFGQIRSVP